MLSSAASARYGRASGGIVNAVTRSGGNALHGSAFYFHRNDNFDARNFFDPSELPEFRRHQYGASLGGPITRNRTFYFVNYEGLREARGRTTIDTTLSDDARRGVLTSGTVAVDPLVAPYVDLYPRPNREVFGDTGLFVFANDTVGDEDFLTTRIDHSVSDRDKLFLRYTFDDGARAQETAFALGKLRNSTRNQSAVIEETHYASASLVNTARIGFLRTYTVSGGTETNNPATDDAALAFLPGGSVVGILDVSGLTDFPGGSGALDADIHAFNSYQFSDDLHLLHGNHSLRVGATVERTQFNTDSQSRVSGDYRFRSIAQFLTNQPDRFRAQLPGSDTVRGHRQWIAAWYVEDNWKLTPRFTLNLGMRHEFASVPAEVNGKVANLDEITSPAIRVGDPLFDNPSMRNFHPRIGLAWDPRGDGKTVVRSGYGIFPDLILSPHLLLAAVRNPPFFSRGSTRNLEQGDFPKNGFGTFVGDSNPELRLDRLERSPKQPYVQQWNLTVEQSLTQDTSVRVAYVGSHGIALSAIVEDSNLKTSAILPDGRYFFPEQGPTLNPNFSRIRDRKFVAQSFYHGLQTHLRKRFSHGFQLLASYTYSKSIDDSSSFFATSESENSNMLPFNGDVRYNRGLSGHDVRHNLALSSSWELPSPRSGPGRALLGGWRLASIITHASGLPATVRLGYDAARTGTRSTDGRSGQRPDVAPGAGDPHTGDFRRWVDPAAFLRPQPGFLGNLGRNTITGPALSNVDFSLTKSASARWAGEAATMEFRAEFFNLFNNTNFDLPGARRMEVFSEDSIPEDFGRITSARESREIQFGIKLRF